MNVILLERVANLGNLGDDTAGQGSTGNPGKC